MYGYGKHGAIKMMWCWCWMDKEGERGNPAVIASTSLTTLPMRVLQS